MENQQTRLNTSEINKAYAALKIYANANEEIKQQYIKNIKGRRIGYYYRNRTKKKEDITGNIKINKFLDLYI